MADFVTVESSDEGEDNSDGLSGEECNERCKTFAEITGTDTALAMFYLQDREWNVERSLNDYFLSKGNEDKQPSSQIGARSSQSLTVDASTTSLTTTKSNDNEAVGASSSTQPINYLTNAPPVIQPSQPGQIRLLSWNIDGLDPDNLQSRTQGVCSVLLQENPEVIFLQEVVQRSLTIIQSKLSNYHVYPGFEDSSLLSLGAYFTALLVRKDAVTTENVGIAEFPTTKMYRNLLMVTCRIRSIPMTLMTSHLESTAEYSAERKKQLKIAFDEMKKHMGPTGERTVVFGGDLNLRDKELSGISAKPPGIFDIWECTGKRPEAKFTWDLTRNDNKQLHSKFQPRCRFDRIYIGHPKDSVRLKPVYFELVGIQRLSSCQRFPSDHWGILSHFSILD